MNEVILNSLTVIIPVGGSAGSFSPLSTYMPKSMAFVGDRPIIHHILDSFKKLPINQAYIVLGDTYGEIFQQYITNNKSISLPVKFIHATKKIRYLSDFLVYAKNEIKTPFIVHYGDILLEKFDFNKMFAFHKIMKQRYGCLGTLGVNKSYSIGIGVATTNEKKLLTGFEEKPTTGHLAWNMAISIFEPSFLKYVKKGDDLFGNSVQRALNDGMNFATYEHNDGWHHIHTIADLYKQQVERYSCWIKK